MLSIIPPKDTTHTPTPFQMRVAQIHEQGTGAMNEDALLIGENIFGVFDGATSFDAFTDEQGRTGGFLASQIAKETFAQNTETLHDAALAANRNIKLAMDAMGIDTVNKIRCWCSTLAVVTINPLEQTFAWIQITDSLILIINKDGTHQMLIENYDHDQKTMICWRALADNHEENIREKLNNIFLEVRNATNADYGALNGDPEAERFFKQGNGSLRNIAHILIFTDGLIIPKTNPKAPDDFALMTKIFLEKGLLGVRDHVRDLQNSDPKCWVYPRGKHGDDIAAIALSFN